MTTKHPRQATLMDSWGMTSSKRQALDQDEVRDSGTESESDIEDHLPGSQSSSLVNQSSSDVYPESSSGPSQPTDYLTSSESCAETSLSESVSPVQCTGLCCSSELEPFQPKSAEALRSLARNGRKFLPFWFKQYPWLTVCTTTNKVYCFYCKFAMKHNLVVFSKNSNPAFTEAGFCNWKKAHEKFGNHSVSHVHKEAKMKWLASGKPTLQERFSTQMVLLQNSRRKALLHQLSGLRFLLRQGLAVRGHIEVEGNLRQLLMMWASASNSDLKSWLKENKYMSHDIVNKQITIMGQTLLRTLLASIKEVIPSWYAIIADEAADVVNREQLNLSIRWVNNEYTVSEDPVGLFCLPDTTANTITKVLKDLLIRCAFPISLCRGQAYDGALNMQGIRKGVATQIKHKCPAALPVHCFAHSLNLCLQDAGRQIALLRDALDIVREISQLIRMSPKRSHLFNQKLAQSDSSGVSIKPLCPTRWTARTTAIEAIIKDYSVLMDAMEEINHSTHDEYGLKAKGILAAMEKFDTLFGLKLGYLLFGAAEEVSKCLQTKDISLQEALSAVNLASGFYRRQRTDVAFDLFYEGIAETALDLGVGTPQLPRYRRAPLRIDDGAPPHRFASPREYYRSLYFQACDLLLRELEDRFDQKELLPPVLALENLIIKAANGEGYDDAPRSVEESCFAEDLNFD